MTTPQHSAEIDRKARELLAAEYRTIGDITCANAISTDPDICGREKLAIRAIEAALSLTPPAATDGRELPEPDYVETIPASHFKDEPTARHWYSAETLRRMMQATTSAAAVPEGWVFEILTNIKRSAIRGRNAAGTPDNALASSFVATCDHIENLADQALSAAPQPQADHFADVGKMMPQAEATRQPVTCKSDLQVQPEAKAGADVVGGEVLVAVHGLTGSGKSAVAGEIEILCKALGLEVRWENGDEEKFLTHADWTHALEIYKPRVRIIEVNTPRNKQ